MRLDLFRRELGDPAQVEHVSQLREWIRAAVAKLRNLMFELRPPILDEEGLAAAIDEYAAYWNLEQTITLHDHFSEEPPEEQRLLLYRIAQEAFANIRKHSKATSVEITLEQEERVFLVRMVDDGVGFDPGRAVGVKEGHIGLSSMRERAEMAGGGCRIRSLPGRGDDGRVLGSFLVADRRSERTTERGARGLIGSGDVLGVSSYQRAFQIDPPDGRPVAELLVETADRRVPLFVARAQLLVTVRLRPRDLRRFQRTSDALAAPCALDAGEVVVCRLGLGRGERELRVPDHLRAGHGHEGRLRPVARAALHVVREPVLEGLICSSSPPGMSGAASSTTSYIPRASSSRSAHVTISTPWRLTSGGSILVRSSETPFSRRSTAKPRRSAKARLSGSLSATTASIVSSPRSRAQVEMAW